MGGPSHGNFTIKAVLSPISYFYSCVLFTLCLIFTSLEVFVRKVSCTQVIPVYVYAREFVLDFTGL